MKEIERQNASELEAASEASSHPTSSAALRNIDVFAAINVGLFLILCVFAYFDRFIAYRGAANLQEFVIYAIAILAGIGSLWLWFRYYVFDTALLLLLQFGICLHFAGALVAFDDLRLYDLYFFSLRYDKYVHFVNAFAVAMLIWTLVRKHRVAVSVLSSAAVICIVLGLGALVELVEYGVVKTVAQNGVGDYDNNMQDLLANLLGSTLGVVVLNRLWQARSVPVSETEI